MYSKGVLLMTFEEIVQKVTEVYAGADTSRVSEHAAIEIDVLGEGEGAFYVEMSPGRIVVAPYNYYDRDAVVTVFAKHLMELIEGKTDVENAYIARKIHVRGSLDKVYLLTDVLAE